MVKIVIGDDDKTGYQKLQEVVKQLTKGDMEPDFISDIYTIFYSDKPSLISPLEVPTGFMNRYLFLSYLLLSSKWTRLLTKSYRERSIFVSAIVIDDILTFLNPKIDEHKQILNEIMGKPGKEVSVDTIKRLVDYVIISLQKRMTNVDLIMYAIRALTESDSLDPFSEMLVIRFLNKVVDYPWLVAEIVKMSKSDDIRQKIVEEIESGTPFKDYPHAVSYEDAVKMLKNIENHM